MPARLRLIPGGLEQPISIGGQRLIPFAYHATPPQSPARVVEQDRYLLLAEQTRLKPESVHPIRLHTETLEQEPLPIATVIERAGRLMVVVYDIDAETITEPQWISEAYRAVINYADAHAMPALTLSLLGCRYGIVHPLRSCGWLLEVLEQSRCVDLHTLYLRLGADELRSVMPYLQARR